MYFIWFFECSNKKETICPFCPFSDFDISKEKPLTSTVGHEERYILNGVSSVFRVTLSKIKSSIKIFEVPLEEPHKSTKFCFRRFHWTPMQVACTEFQLISRQDMYCSCKNMIVGYLIKEPFGLQNDINYEKGSKINVWLIYR